MAGNPCWLCVGVVARDTECVVAARGLDGACFSFVLWAMVCKPLLSLWWTIAFRTNGGDHPWIMGFDPLRRMVA